MFPLLYRVTAQARTPHVESAQASNQSLTSAATPTFNPAAGVYATAQSVSLADVTPGAIIYYTVDGSAPTTGSPVYSGAITVGKNTTIKAVAIAGGYGPSASASATYMIRTAQPTFNPSGGTYTGPQSVTIADSTPGVVIHYTLDGTYATANSPVYSGPITITNSSTLNATAVASDYAASLQTSGGYTIRAAQPSFNPAPGVYGTSQVVSISDTTPGAVIHYTLDGNFATTASPVYTGPVTISRSAKLTAMAVASGKAVSLQSIGTYTIHVQPVLQWSSASPLAVNMPISAAGLSVTAVNPVTKATIPGTVTWAPSLTSHFSSPGPQQVTAKFMPTDTVDYGTAQSTITITVQPFGITCWGDSLMGGASRSAIPVALGKLVTLPVVDESSGGQSSTQIGVREGAVSAQATISGGVIPASGSVGITFVTGYEPVNNEGPAQGVSGTIGGIHGTVTYMNQGLVFTRSVAGNSTVVNPLAQFKVDTPYASYLPVFWEGRDNFGRTAQVLADIAAQVASVPAGQDYLVLSILNGDSPLEYKGGTRYQEILSINNQLANIYGTHYLDARSLLVNAYDPTSILDITNYQRDVPPTSLRSVLGTGKLANAIGAEDTTFAVNLGTGSLRVGAILTIDTGTSAENVQISSFSGSTVTVMRGVAGNAAAHAAGAAVAEVDSVHLRAQGLQLLANAIANYLHEVGDLEARVFALTAAAMKVYRGHQ